MLRFTDKPEDDLKSIDGNDDKRPVRNRKKKINNDFVETPTRRTKKQTESEASKILHTEEPVKKVARKQLNLIAEDRSLESTPVTRSKRAPVKQIEADSTPISKRAAKSKKEEEPKPTTSHEITVAEKETIAEETWKAPKRQEKATKKPAKKQHDEPKEIPIEETKPEPEVKELKRRGRAAKAVEKQPEQKEQKIAEKEPESQPEVSLTKRRGRPGKQVEKVEEPPKIVENHDENPVQPAEQTKRKGKQEKETVVEEVPSQSESEVKELPKRRGRPAKHVEKEPERDEEDAKETAEKESKTTKRKAASKTTKKDDTEKEIAQPETPKVKPAAKRGRAKSPEKIPEEEQIDSPPKRARRAAAATSKVYFSSPAVSHVQEITPRTNRNKVAAAMPAKAKAVRGKKVEAAPVEIVDLVNDQPASASSQAVEPRVTGRRKKAMEATAAANSSPPQSKKAKR